MNTWLAQLPNGLYTDTQQRGPLVYQSIAVQEEPAFKGSLHGMTLKSHC